MRKLMWFTIGFTCAVVAGVYLASGIWLAILALFSLLCAVGLCYMRSRWSRIASITLIGCVVGLVWLSGFDWLYLSNARAYDGETVNAAVTVTDYSYDSGYGTAADGKLMLDGKTYKVRLYANTEYALKPGDTVQGAFRLRFTADGGEKAPTFHQGKGIFLLAYGTDDVQITYASHVPASGFAVTLRQKIVGILDAVFPEDTLAFARALLLGDDSLLSYETDTDFKISGIRHVIAVSGLHVSILFSLVYLLCGKRRILTAVLGIPVLVLFAAVAGFTPSIVRACIMQSLMIFAMLINKEYDPPTALSFAVLVMLAVNPLTVTSASFQLSVGCMVGIFLFSGRIRAYLLDEKRFGPSKGKSLKAKLTRWTTGSISVTLGAMATTTPLCAYYFGTVSLVGILTNLLTLWVISFVFYGIMAACIAGVIWIPLGSCIAWVVSWPIRYVLMVARILASFPLAAVYTCSVYIVAWLVFCYVLLGLFLCSKKKRPILLAFCVAIGLAGAVAAARLEVKTDSYRFTVLDVGQGQCLLLQWDGKHYMVDCGGDMDSAAADLAVQLLLSQGITELDGLLLTHYDRDHAGGAVMLLSRIDADALYLPDIADTSGIRDVLTDLYADKIQWIGEESTFTIPDSGITLFSTKAVKDDNESSMCVLFQPENCDILITGDRSSTGEKALLAYTQLPKLDILVVGHHGAKDSACMELLWVTRPAVAVICVGADNTYGHPAQDVLERLGLIGSKVLRTDTDGTIIFRG